MVQMMKKSECKDLIERLGKFLIKNKNMYSQDMSEKLKEKYSGYVIACSNEKIDVKIEFVLRK